MCTEASVVRAARSVPRSDSVVEKLGVDRVVSDPVIDRYIAYLTVERGLTAGTVRLYAQMASRCLDEWARSRVGLDALDAAGVIGFVVAESKRSSTAVMKNVVTGLRSLLRFMFAKRLTSRQLVDAVPSVAGWQMTSLPRALEPGQVRGLITSCDRDTVVGRRDYAILCRCGVWGCEPARSQPLGSMTWTGVTVNSSFAERAATRSACRSQSMSARHSSHRYATADRPPLMSSCSGGCAPLWVRSPPVGSGGWCIRRATVPVSPGSGLMFFVTRPRRSCFRAGVPVKVISERLGHESPAFTLKQYAHVIPGMQAEAAAQIAAIVISG